MKHKGLKIFISLILIVLILLSIFKLSSMNTKSSNGKSTDIISLFIEDTLDITNKYEITNSHPTDEKILKASILLNKPLRKVMHASVYFLLAISILAFINLLFNNDKYLLSSIITIILIVILASLDEYHQTFVFGRTGQVKDVIIDSIGAIIGIIFYGTYYFIYRMGIRRGKELSLTKK